MNLNLTWKRKRKEQEEGQQHASPLVDAKWELYKTVMVAILSEDKEDLAKPVRTFIRQGVRANDPGFVTRLAIRLQEQMHENGMSFLLSTELALQWEGEDRLVSLIAEAIRHAAFLPEWLDAYKKTYFDFHGKAFYKPTRSLVKALTPVFNRLDEFQYTRYDRELQRKWRNALFLVRPAAIDKEQRALFRKILKDQLPCRVDWPEGMRRVYEQHYDSLTLKKATIRDKWEEGILSWKIGYPDLLDQLPVMLQAGIGGKAVKLLALYISNAGAVAKNGLQPSRYLEAYRALRQSGHHRTGLILEALEKAAILSGGNIPGFTADTRTVIAMDVSNSMNMPIRENALTQRFDIGPLVAMSLQYRISRMTTGIFGNTWKQIGLPGFKMLEELDAFQSREGEVGYAANGWIVIRELILKKKIADKILIFTDCRLWNSRLPNQSPGTDIARLWKQYKQLAPHARLYLFDLAAYGDPTVEILPDEAILVSGWNEKVFSVLDMLESRKEIW